MNYSTTVKRDDWNAVLEQARTANVFHTPEYFDAQTTEEVGHRLLYLCCYDEGRPVGVIAGYENASGYHRGLAEVGTKSGGCPVMIDEYDQRPDADRIKNTFIRHYLERCLGTRPYLFYPCFNMADNLFEQEVPGVVRQVDSTAFIDLGQPEETLWKNLRDKGRNLVRAGRRKGVTTGIVRHVRHFDRFYELYRALRERLNTGYIGYVELRLKFDRFTAAGLADFWVAFVEDEPVAFNFMWTYGKYVNYIYNASDPAYLKFNPNNVLQWDMMRHYRNQGFETYNLWGLRNMHLEDRDHLQDERPIAGYGKFKLSLGAEVRDLLRYVKL